MGNFKKKEDYFLKSERDYERDVERTNLWKIKILLKLHIFVIESALLFGKRQRPWREQSSRLWSI